MNMFRDVMQRLLVDLRHNNPQISKQDMDTIIARVEERVASEPPPRVAFIGQTGVGKSSTLNALFDAGRPVSHIEAETQIAAEIPVAKGTLVVYDMPGLGESRAARSRHEATYERVLRDVDVALWVLDAQYRAIESDQQYLQDQLSSINPSLINRLVIALNKVDLVYPGETAWVRGYNIPSTDQEKNIQGRIQDVTRKLRDVLPAWNGTVIGYSADKRYNLPQLFKEMLDAVPAQRQWVLASRKALADFFELVDTRLIPDKQRYVSQTGAASFSVNRSPSRLKDESTYQKRSRAHAKPHSRPNSPQPSEIPANSDILERIRNMTPEEFAEASTSPAGLEEWLRKNALKSGKELP